MDRRNFVRTVQWGYFGLSLPPSFVSFGSEGKENKLSVLKIVKHDSIALPDGKRVSFNWPACGINPGGSITIKPLEKITNATYYWLRVSVAQESRDEKLLQVSIHGTGIELGTIKIFFSSVLVMYELEVPAKYIDLIGEHGLELKLESPTSLWLFSEKAAGTDNTAFLPHILCASERQGTKQQFLNCFTSVNSLQSFGWREGDVLDGLWQLYKLKRNKQALKTIHEHLSLYFDRNNLNYENGQSIPISNEINGIESTLPFATLARVQPNHPMIDIALKGLRQFKKPDGIIMDNGITSAEGCYTVAYPLAVIGKTRKDLHLMQEAVDQLKHRFILCNGNEFFLRYSTDGKYTFRNWARGVAWNLLGFVRTMAELKNDLPIEDVKKKFVENVQLAVSMQRSDGLWGSFMDNTDSLPDTSGSAGIAAAIATGIRENFLPESYKSAVNKCWNGLQLYLTADGFLKGVAQDNRGGRKLQESDYRVIGQIGMGLMAQMAAEI